MSLPSLVTAGFSQYPVRWNEKIRVLPHDRLLNWVVLRFLPKFVKPNHLTVLRLILTVPVLTLLIFGNYGWGLAFFLLAGLTDAMDGSLARIRKEVSEWGIIWDPVAESCL